MVRSVSLRVRVRACVYVCNIFNGDFEIILVKINASNALSSAGY
jgi:hypothetical protein